MSSPEKQTLPEASQEIELRWYPEQGEEFEKVVKKIREKGTASASVELFDTRYRIVSGSTEYTARVRRVCAPKKPCVFEFALKVEERGAATEKTEQGGTENSEEAARGKLRELILASGQDADTLFASEPVTVKRSRETVLFANSCDMESCRGLTAHIDTFTEFNGAALTPQRVSIEFEMVRGKGTNTGPVLEQITACATELGVQSGELSDTGVVRWLQKITKPA